MKRLPTCTGIAVIKPPVTWEKFDLPGLQILSCDPTAPKLSTNDNSQFILFTEDVSTRKSHLVQKEVKVVFSMSQIMSSYIHRVKTTTFKWTSHTKFLHSLSIHFAATYR